MPPPAHLVEFLHRTLHRNGRPTHIKNPMALSGTVPHGTPKFHGWLEFPHLNGHNSGVIYMPKKRGCNFDPVREKGGGGCERMCIPLRTKTKSYKQLHYAPLPIPIGEKWSLSGWWYTYPSEKYEFVSWDYSSQHISEKKTKTL